MSKFGRLDNILYVYKHPWRCTVTPLDPPPPTKHRHHHRYPIRIFVVVVIDPYLGRDRESEQVVYVHELCFEEADGFFGGANRHKVQRHRHQKYDLE